MCGEIRVRQHVHGRDDVGDGGRGIVGVVSESVGVAGNESDDE